jgi:hypothetical protein
MSINLSTFALIKRLCGGDEEALRLSLFKKLKREK